MIDAGGVGDGMSSLVLDGRHKKALRALLDNEDFAEEMPAPLKSVAEFTEELRCQPALLAVLNRFKRFSDETQDAIDKQLCLLVTRIANEHAASVAWLFVKRDDGLHAVFAHKNRYRDKFLANDEESMAIYVARSGLPLAAPDVSDRSQVPAYKIFPDMRAAISTPLKTRDGETIGVLHLESTEPGRYQEADLAEFIASAVALVPPLLILRALNRDDDLRFPWRSFDITSQLDDLCLDLRRVIEGIQCTIWTVDAESSALFVHNTTGFANEFIDKRILSLNSFNGVLTTLPPGASGTVRPGEPTRIEIKTTSGIETREGPPASIQGRLKDHDALRWRKSVGVPLYVRLPGESTPEARCTLSLSCFDEESEPALPSRDELTQIAAVIGDFITGYFALREELARIHLALALDSGNDSKADFKAIERKFTEFLSLKTVAIDGYLEGIEERFYLTKGRFGPAILTRASLDLLRTIHLDVNDERGNRLGTFHLSRSRPFTASEKDLAAKLAKDCVGAFTKWQYEIDDAKLHQYVLNGT